MALEAAASAVFLVQLQAQAAPVESSEAVAVAATLPAQVVVAAVVAVRMP